MANKKIVEDVNIEAVNEVPKDAEIVEDVVIDAPADVAEEIVENLGKKTKNYQGDLRGFKTLEEAINYPNTEAFKKLDVGCRTEYTNWLKENIL